MDRWVVKREERSWTYSMSQKVKLGAMCGSYREADFSLTG
jgi:hypothetical protein